MKEHNHGWLWLMFFVLSAVMIVLFGAVCSIDTTPPSTIAPESVRVVDDYWLSQGYHEVCGEEYIQTYQITYCHVFCVIQGVAVDFNVTADEYGCDIPFEKIFPKGEGIAPNKDEQIFVDVLEKNYTVYGCKYYELRRYG